MAGSPYKQNTRTPLKTVLETQVNNSNFIRAEGPRKRMLLTKISSMSLTVRCVDFDD